MNASLGAIATNLPTPEDIAVYVGISAAAVCGVAVVLIATTGGQALASDRRRPGP